MRWIMGLLVAIATITIALPYALDGAWPWVVGTVAAGLIWIVVPPHSYNWTASILLFCFALLAAVVVLRYSSLTWVMPGLIAALGAWDLCALTERLAQVNTVQDRPLFLRQHLLQLSGVLLGSWILSLLAQQVTIAVNLLWAIGAVILLTLGLSIVVRAARASEIDDSETTTD